MRVAICIPTFKRTKLLRELLRGISELTFQKVPEPELQVIVVDNDGSGTAASVCSSTSIRWPAKYFIEPRRGISQTRNRAIREAGEADFIAFIDDDEVPAPAWLDELLWTQKQSNADAVAGPVAPSFTGEVSEWVKGGKLFERPQHVSGECLEFCATGNVLIRRTVFDRVPAFDERFALTGGEDTHFFLRVRRAGFKIVWSADSLAYERISANRANLGWLLRRAYRGGNSWVLVESTLDKRVTTRLVRVAKAFGRIILGCLRAPVSLFQGKAAVTRALQSICLGAGMLAGLADWDYQEYSSAGSDPAKQVAAQQPTT
ncbi:MAG: glycosyltransferase [Candidatus Acidiferrales bacterium]